MVIARILALLGFGISSYLFALKATGKISSIVGCGAESGCANVLGSEWSEWFRIPVSAISALFYLFILVLSVKRPEKPLTLAAYLLIGAACWFMGLQIFVIKSFCPWCLATHLIGLATAAAILASTKSRLAPSLAAAAFSMIAVLALGQVFGPKPPTQEITSDQSLEKRKTVTAQTQGDGRLITFEKSNGDLFKSYRLGSVPLIGAADAEHVLVKYFDYTCNSCREMEGDLEKLRELYPKKIAIIVLPTPLNRACNPYLAPNIKNHDDACELARLGLAAWKAKPESFEKAHEILFRRPIHSPESARAELEELIPSEEFEAAMKDPWVAQALKASIEDYRLFAAKSPVMPKLMISGSQVAHGTARSTSQFVDRIEKILKLR